MLDEIPNWDVECNNCRMSNGAKTRDDVTEVNVAKAKARLNTLKCEREEAKSWIKEAIDVPDVSMHVNGELNEVVNDDPKGLASYKMWRK